MKEIECTKFNTKRQSRWIFGKVKPSGHSKIDKMKVLKTGDSLMQV